MSADAEWLDIGPGAITGFGGAQPDLGSGGVHTGVENVVSTDAGPYAPAYSPDSPLFWVAATLVATGALVFIVHHVHASARASAGPASATITV